jgi:hypothetical protein
MAVDLVTEIAIARPRAEVSAYAAERDAGDGATRMTLRNRGRPSGFARVTAPAMAAAMRRANVADLARIRDLLEARTTP